MPQEGPYRLLSVSVVVTAEFHNPSILNPDFLKFQGIVPKDWEPKLAITTPQFSNIRFHNGIDWTVDQSKLTVVETCESQFQDSYLAYDLVASYIERLPHVPYRSHGLNFVVAFPTDEPQQWLTNQYLKDGDWLHGEPAVRSMAPKFTFAADEEVLCFLNLDANRPARGKHQAVPAVIAEGNLHHEGPLDAGALRDAIDRWPQRQEFAIAALDRLFGNERT